MVDKEKIYSLHEQGKSAAEIAEECGCTPGYVQDLTRRKYGKRNVDAGRIKALWKNKWSMNMIMKDTGLSEDEVQKVVFNEKR